MTKRLILAALPLLAACATAGASPAQLAGTSWSFTAIDDAPPISSKAVLTIEADRIGANVGCNGMGGDLKIEAERLVIGPVISTKMFCDGVMGQEMAVGDLLGSSPSYKLKGDKLRLEGGGHSAELTRVQ